MNGSDLRKIIGTTDGETDYAPVGMLLRSGYACYGHFNSNVNDGLDETLVVLNASLMELKASVDHNRPSVEDFREFLLDMVAAYDVGAAADIAIPESFGKQIPLIAIPMDEIALVYPVSHIIELLSRADKTKNRTTPTLLRFRSKRDSRCFEREALVRSISHRLRVALDANNSGSNGVV